MAELTSLLARVQNAPLPASYRALGESPLLREDARVKVLVDSLVDIEREREEFGAGGGVDPIFVSLTTRATAIGRSIQAIAEVHLEELRRELAKLRPPSAAAPAPTAVRVDTLGPAVRRASAQRELDEAMRTLTEARQVNAEIERRLREARERANIFAPPIAILAAAIVLGLTLGFAITLVIEAQEPHIADMQEIERATGARALAAVKPRMIPSERARRKADQRLPPLLDPTSDAYRLLAAHLLVAREGAGIMTLTGDAPEVTAAIAANVAAVLANDVRGTLLVDADFRNHAVSGVLRIPSDPGLGEALAQGVDWSAHTRQVAVGRDRVLDMLPSGVSRRSPLRGVEAENFRQEIRNVARRYDMVVLVAPLGESRHLRPGRNVLVCAHAAHTPLSELKQGVAALRDDGAHVIGVVLWDADAPNVPVGDEVMAQWRALTEEAEEHVPIGAGH